MKKYKKLRIKAWTELVLIAFSAFLLSIVPPFSTFMISPLIICVVFGIVIANIKALNTKIYKTSGAIAFGTKQILRLGIILYGFRISLADIELVGLGGIFVAFCVVSSTFALGVLIGAKLGLGREDSALIASGSAICGAAAIMASASVLKSSTDKIAVAVCTVVVYGTIFMFALPVLYNAEMLPFTQGQAGFFTGTTIHEVAHAVGAGAGIGTVAEKYAIIEKMLRVLMLVPFLLVLSFLKPFISAVKEKGGVKQAVPYFAIWFLLCVFVGSSEYFPREILVGYINFIDTLLLSLAMLCLGLTIKKSVLLNAGKKPFILAFALAIWLVCFGGILTKIFAGNL